MIDDQDDVSQPMNVRPSITPAQARALFDALELPEHVTLADEHPVPLIALATAIADDTHPGDDSIPPFWLRDSARSGVKLKRLAKLVREAGGTLALTGTIARECCDIYSDELRCLGNQALSDVEQAGLLGSYSPCMNPVRDEAAALAVIVGALLYEKAQQDPPKKPRKRREPKMGAKALATLIQNTDAVFDLSATDG